MNQLIARSLAIVAFLAAIVISVNHFSAAERGDDLRLWFFDVGQGDSELIDTPDGHQILIDGGPDSGILQRLSRALPLADKSLDLVIVSHNHSDHLKGLTEVLRHYQVAKIWLSGAIHTTDTYRDFLTLVKEKSIPTEVVTAGQTVAYGDLAGVVIFPLTNETGQLPDNQHDANIITYWQYGATTFILTGDAESEHEQAQLSRGVVRPATILKLGHHGSRTSSSEAYLRAVQPKVAIISAGIRNRYGHPHPETLETLKRLTIPWLGTYDHGTIRFDLTLSSYSVKTGL